MIFLLILFITPKLRFVSSQQCQFISPHSKNEKLQSFPCVGAQFGKSNYHLVGVPAWLGPREVDKYYGCPPQPFIESSIKNSLVKARRFDVIGLVHRGAGCSFAEKAKYAQDYYRVQALIIVNFETSENSNKNEGEDFIFAMAASEADQKLVHIPVLMVAADWLRNNSMLSNHSLETFIVEEPGGIFSDANDEMNFSISLHQVQIIPNKQEDHRQKKPISLSNSYILGMKAVIGDLIQQGQVKDVMDQMNAIIPTSILPQQRQNNDEIVDSSLWLYFVWLSQDLCLWENIEQKELQFKEALSLEVFSERPKNSVGLLCPKLSPSLGLGIDVVLRTCLVYSDWLQRRSIRSSYINYTMKKYSHDLNQNQNLTSEIIDKKKKNSIQQFSQKTSHRKLRIGYSSAFLKKKHPINNVLGGMFREHNKSRVLITCMHLNHEHHHLENNTQSNDDDGCDISYQIESDLLPLKHVQKQIILQFENNFKQIRNSTENINYFNEIDIFSAEYFKKYNNDDNDESYENNQAVQTVQNLMNYEIDVLIDIDGYTRDIMPGLLAYSGHHTTQFRDIPVKMHYLGTPHYPIRLPQLDWFLSDARLTPPEVQGSKQGYEESNKSWMDSRGEKLFLLPHYMMHQPLKKQKIQTKVCEDDDSGNSVNELRRIARKNLGVTEDTFLLACFNQAKKITPLVFSVWMNVLRNCFLSHHRCQLWLPQITIPSARQSLINEALAQGIPSQNLLFSKHVNDRELYLLNMHAVDCALDTPRYSSGSVAVELFLQGIPLIILADDHSVAARQALSIAHTASSFQLPPANSMPQPNHFVVYSLKEYELLALYILQQKANVELEQKQNQLDGEFKSISQSLYNSPDNEFNCYGLTSKKRVLDLERASHVAFEVKSMSFTSNYHIFLSSLSWT